MLMPWLAGATNQSTSGRFTILDQKVSWKRIQTRAASLFEIRGVRTGPVVKVKYPNGKEKWISTIPVETMSGALWNSAQLMRQTQINTQSKTQVIADNPEMKIDKIQLDPMDVKSWQWIAKVPTPVRASIRKPLRRFVRDHYQKLQRAVRTALSSDSDTANLPHFVRCLTLPREKYEQGSAADVVHHFREDFFEPCLGLISPATVAIADPLINRKAPVPVGKRYFAYDDPARPDWSKPTLLLVHASSEFHFPSNSKAAMEKWVERFHTSGNPVAFLYHNDGFRDASYFLSPGPKDFVLFSETGQHLLCENCPEVTLAGGYIDWCLGLAARSYIANYFKNKETGEIRINFATDSIYTEADSGKNSMGAFTALDEIKSDGTMTFIHKRLSQYFVNAKVKDVSKALCRIDEPMTDECKLSESDFVLSDLDGEDGGGRFFPFLQENRFRFRIQIDGVEFIHPIGDPSLKRTILFNIVTK